MKDHILITETKSILTVKDVARHISVSTSFVYDLIKSGVLEATKVGCRYRIAVKDLYEYLEQ